MNYKALANWNGQEMLLKDVKVSVLDRAFLFGDAVYEVVRVYQGRLFRLNDHLQRLHNSLLALSISGLETSTVCRRLQQTLDSRPVADGLAYIQVTRGEGVRHHHYPKPAAPNVLIYIDAFDDPYKAGRIQGIHAVTYPDIRWSRNDIKTTSLAANCLAAQYAHEQGCADAIFIDDKGLITEGSHTSVFAVKEGKIVVTPASAKVLPGITKKQVLELAYSSGIPIVEGRVRESEINKLDELFLAGTPEEILAVVRVNDRPVGTGKPGPVVKKLQAEFARALSNWLSSGSD